MSFLEGLEHSSRDDFKTIHQAIRVIENPRKESIGHPIKYYGDVAKAIYEQHEAGSSIRAIAKERKMSPTTVHKLLRSWTQRVNRHKQQDILLAVEPVSEAERTKLIRRLSDEAYKDFGSRQEKMFARIDELKQLSFDS